MPKYTVFVREDSGEGTTHISAHEAKDCEEAKQLALDETAGDWGQDHTANLMVLGVAEGDVNILEWDD